MSNEFCSVERDGHLTIVTLNRPEVMNAVHPLMSYELDVIWNDFESDPDQWVAIITGAGDRAFSAGNDLKYAASGGSITLPDSGFAGITNRFNMTKPVIAAVNGTTMGGGFEIALMADIIIAAENAVFSFPEPKVGLAALSGGMHRLPRMIPYQQAMGMLLTCRQVAAAEGKAMGFVTEVVPQGSALEEAKKCAAMILECSPMSIRATKESVVEGLKEKDVETAMSIHYPSIVALFNSEDIREGPTAFAEKRAPQWKGR
ncbi:MAG: enoyl-CoA hydratase-related protein [Pseudomonadales bacterium]